MTDGKTIDPARPNRLSTGFKMLLILSLGLFPLGLIAILASVQSARDNRVDRDEEVQAQVALAAQQLNDALERATLTVRAASAAIDASDANSAVCERTLARLAQGQMLRGSYALYGEDGRMRCATPGFAPAQPQPRAAPNETRAAIMGGEDALRLILYGPRGSVEAVAGFPRSAVATITRISERDDAYRLELMQGRTAMTLHETSGGSAFMRDVLRTSPVAGDQLQLRMVSNVASITAIELLTVLLPIVMWISAAIIGWMIVDRLLLKPLVRMQKVVSAYRPGDRELDMPTFATPAREIGELGEAFDEVTRTVARHEAELEAAVDRQTRLVREVHHRVKNNLQVVASLLNLHSRGSRNEEVAAAYASIQRRVDALAVVHRNHYAELEENRGVALKPLISEIAANLRATAPKSATGMTISLHIEPYYVTQDVAVSVAFLITEIVEFAMFCGASGVRISLAGATPASAMLSIESDSLHGDAQCEEDLSERFDRIITGLSRQLRSTMTRDTDAGIYSLAIAVAEKAER